MAVPPKYRGQKSEDRGFRAPKIPNGDAPATPGGSTGGNIKTIGDRSKVFFRGRQFSLAFGEKKSILRNKKRALELLASGLGETENSVEEKNERESLLLLTKSSIFDK